MSEVPNEWIEVAPSEAGRRLDVFLAERLRISRGAVRRLLASGAVRVAGRALGEGDKGLALRAGERVAVESGAAQPRLAAEPDAPLAVLAQGPGWLVADKPAGVPVHPLGPGERGTLVAAVAARHPEIDGVGEGGLRSGVVHRLDVDTSGALLVATSQPQWERLRAAFREHRVEKVYRAIALGRVAADGEIALPLVTARHRPAFVRAATDAERDGARETITSWRVVEHLRASRSEAQPSEGQQVGATLLEVRTVTGFLHQVRATLAHLGHPLAGDRTYAPGGDTTGAARHMLHAASLRFEEIAAESPDPRDFAALVASLRA